MIIAMICSSLAVLASPCKGTDSGMSDIQFEDWSEKVGLDYRGQTWGASWRDFDGDGYPDFFVSNHFTFPPGNEFSDVAKSPAGLYRNLSGSKVVDLGRQLLGKRPGDWHGGTWIDFDNDGDADLFVSRGGGAGASKERTLTKLEVLLSKNLFFVQEDGSFFERGAELGLSLPSQRGRGSSWLDADGDGKPDVLLAQAAPDDGSSILYLQKDSGFEPCLNAFPGVGPSDNVDLILVFPGFGDDSRYIQLGGGPGKLYRQKQSKDGCSFEAVPHSKDLARKGTMDSLIADLDGDLALDFFGVRRTTVAGMRQGKRYFRLALPGEADLQSLSFSTSGTSCLSFFPVQGPNGWWSPEQSTVFLGSEGKRPTRAQVVLSPEAEELWGSMDTAEVPTGVFVHYDQETLTWNIRVKKAKAKTLTIDVGSSREIEIVDPPKIGRAPHWNAGVAAHIQGPSGWIKAPGSLGFDTITVSCVSVVAEDFDNDMDMDLFLACRDNAKNQRNVLLENRNGRFVDVRFSGADISDKGLVDSVSTGDFDRDGFPDLLVTNGKSDDRDPEGHGKVQLFHNKGNGHNWLRVELVGTTSSRDAVGSRVFVRAGGITQLRYASGGRRATAQDEPVLHFGLGTESNITELLVEWPDGNLESFEAGTVNRELRLVQGQGTSLQDPIILTSKKTASVDEPLRFLLLWSGRSKQVGISWDVDGTLIEPDLRNFRHSFTTPGKKTITASLRSASGEIVSRSIEVLIR